MKFSKMAALAIAVVALVATLAFVVGCGKQQAPAPDQPQTTTQQTTTQQAPVAQMTLEDYFKAHQSEWDDAVKQIKQSGGDIIVVEMSVSGNQINQIMTYKQTFNDEQVAAMKASLDQNIADMQASLSSQIAQMEAAAGVQGVTWHFEYRNGDGKVISSFTASSK